MGHLPRAVLFIFFLAVFTSGHFSANAQVATLPVASAGQPAPGFEEEGATFHNFFGAFINDSGHVVFAASVESDDVRLGMGGLWIADDAGLKLLVKDGSPMPGLPGKTFRLLNYPSRTGIDVVSYYNIDANGTVCFTSGDSDEEMRSLDHDSIWTATGPEDLALVANVGMSAPGLSFPFTRFIPAAAITNRSNLVGGNQRATTINNGIVAFVGTVDATINGDIQFLQGVWQHKADTLSLVAAQGQVMPGLAPPDPDDDPPLFQSFSEVIVDDQGRIGFVAEGDNSVSTIYRTNTSGGLNLLVRDGVPAPGTPNDAFFREFAYLMTNASGQIAFTGRTTSSFRAGTWILDGATPRNVAYEDNPAPGGGTFAESLPVALADDGSLIFMANINGGASGVWTNDAEGSRALVSVGDSFDDGDITSIGLAGGSDNNVTANAAGRVVLGAAILPTTLFVQSDVEDAEPEQAFRLALSINESAPGFEGPVRGSLAHDNGDFPETVPRGGVRSGRPQVFNSLGQMVYYDRAFVGVSQVDAQALTVGNTFPNHPNTHLLYSSIDTWSGEYFTTVTELELGGPFPLRFARLYSSLLERSGTKASPLGSNWRHNYEYELTRNNHQVKVALADSTVLNFEKISGEWKLIGPLHVPWKMVEEDDNLLLGEPTGTIYTFEQEDGIGRLASVEDLNGNKHTLEYDEDDQLTRVSDGLGRELTYTWTAGVITKVSDGQRDLSFGYAEASTRSGERLDTVQDAGGFVTTYSYDPEEARSGALLTSILYPEENSPFTLTYGAANNFEEDLVLGYSEMDQTPTTIDYLFGITEVTNPMGDKQSHGYSNFNGAPRLTSYTDEAGNMIQMVYDDVGRRTGIVDRLGGISGFEFDPDSGLTTRKLEADGALTQYAYRAIPKKGMTFYRTRQITMADGTAHSYEYDANGNLTKWTDNGGATWSYAYDGMGMTTSVTHPSGGTNRYTYNADGTFATFTDSAANTMRFDQDASRRLNKITYADGSTYELAYDPRDLLMNVTNEIAQTVSYEYDRNGNTMSITDPTSGKTSWEYDAYDRPVKETDAAGGESSVAFDAMGRPISFTGRDGRTGTLAYDVCSRLESVTDAEGRRWSLTLDAEDMLTGMTDPAGESFSYQADAMGRLTEVTEPGNETHTFEYDVLGRLTSVAGPGGEAYGCAYNARGFATRVDMPGDRMVTYKRNVYGQTTEMTDPEGNTWKRAYDALYRCTQITQPDGTTYRYTFDDRNRVAAIQYPEESGTLMIQYDGVGNVTNLLYQDGVIIDAKTGELKQAVQQSEFDFMKDENGRFVETGSLSLAWNNAGQLVESNGIGNRYDKTNNLVEVTYAPGKTVTYAYEKNRLTKVTDWLGGETVLMYDDKGVMTGLTRPNGKKTTYETSRRGRIEKVTDEVAGTISVQYNDQGRIAGFVHTGTSLPSQSSIWKVRQFGFNSMNHVTGYTYDDQGRLQQDNRRSYSWNAAKRLSSFSASQGGLTETHQLVYDGKGNLLRVLNDLGLEKRNSLYTINYAYPAARIAVESDFGETDSDPITPLWYYVYTPSGALLYRVNAATNKRFFYHYSHTGDVIAMSDDAGNADIQYAYDPYGVIAERSQNILSENKGNPFKYRGALAWFHEPGIRGGLYFTSDGWYDATPMRWLSQGKVAFVGPRDMNPFLARARNEKSWNRFWGGVQTVAGLAEMTVGGAGVIVPEPGSTAGGIVLFAVGYDSYQAGVRQLMSGEATSTLLAYGVAAGAEKLGANPRTAKLIGIGADVTVALLAGNPMSAARSASAAPARGARVLMDPFKGAFSHASFKKVPDQLSAQLYCKHWDLIVDLERAGSKGIVAQRGEWSAQLMAEITAATGKEIGLFRVGGRSGQRVAVLGTKATVPLPTGRGMVYRLIGHTHPSNVLMFSVGDLKVLRDLRWNRLQWLINNGKLSASSSLSKAGLRDSSLLISPYVRPTGRVLRRTVEEGDRIRIEQFLDVVEKARGQVP